MRRPWRPQRRKRARALHAALGPPDTPVGTTGALANIGATDIGRRHGSTLMIDAADDGWGARGTDPTVP